MFTLDQIHQASAKVKSGADFPRFVIDLKSLGITHYENFVIDGHTKYYGWNNFSVEDKAKYEPFNVSDESSAVNLKHAITIHQQGQTDYLTFCRQAAEAGVEKWTTHMIEMTVTYFDKQEKILVSEPIPSAE